MDLPIEPDSDSSGDEATIERSTILPTELEPKDLYLLRPFPSLIGSATFYETDHLGLRLQESSESDGASDAYESERESSGTETEVKQKQKQKGRAEGTGGLAEDSGDSSGDLFSEGESTKEKRKEKGAETPPLEEGGLFNTKPGKFNILNRNKSGDEGNLFDSSSEDEDLFSEGPKKKKEPKQPKLEPAEEPVSASATGTDTEEPKKEKKKKKKKKKPAGAIAVFGMLDSEDSDGDDESERERRSEKFGESVSSTVSATSKDTLFDSDSDGDLFSTHKPTKPKDKTTAAPKQQKQESTPVENDVESHKEKSRFGGDNLNFDDSDSDMDLFENTKAETSSAVKKPIGAVKIFAGLDEADLLGRGSTPPSKKKTPPIPVAKSEKENVSKQPSQAKGMSLYENSSSEDDLFSSMSQARETSKIVKKEEPSKPSSTSVKVPDRSEKDQALGSPPPVTRSQLIANGLKFLDGSDEDSGDDLFSKPMAVKSAVSSAKESQPARATDSPKPVAAVETDELFSGVASGDTQVREDQNHKTESNAIPETKPKETKSKDLFALGSDSDEDLFSLGTNKTVKAPEKKIPEQSLKPPDPVQSKETGHGGLFSEKDELFSAIQSTSDPSLPPTTSRPPKSPPAADLFSEEPDEDDLFSSPASLDLFSGTKPSTPSTAPKPKPAKATLPTLFAPIDTGADEGSIFEQPAIPTGERAPPSTDLPSQRDDPLLPSLTKPPAGNPETLLPTQQNSHERDNAVDTIMAPKDKTENAEGAERSAEPKVSVGKSKDFLKDLNKMMGKGFVPGGPMPKKKETSGFEDEGELFSNTTPKGAEKWPMGAERGASRMVGYEAPEEPSKLVGFTRNRPRGPTKRPPTRGARKKTIQPQSEEFGDFFTEPNESPNLDTGILFNGAIEDNLFAASTVSSHRVKFPASTKSDIETDIFTSGNPNKLRDSTENNVEEELFPANSQVPIKYHSSTVKPEADTKVPPDPSQKTEEVPRTLTPPPLELPEDLFASVALPKATKSSKSGTKQKTVPDPIVTQPQAEPDLTDINFEENSVIKEKPKKSHKVVKRTDEELFGGDDLFGEIPESKPKSKSDKTKKKKGNDTTKKPKKIKEFDPSSIDDIFD